VASGYASSGFSTSAMSPAARCAVSYMVANSGPTTADRTGDHVRLAGWCETCPLVVPSTLRLSGYCAEAPQQPNHERLTAEATPPCQSWHVIGPTWVLIDDGQRSIDRNFFVSHNGGDDEDGPGGCWVFVASAWFLEFPTTWCSQASLYWLGRYPAVDAWPLASSSSSV
jgi:hypothetical protein